MLFRRALFVIDFKLVFINMIHLTIDGLLAFLPIYPQVLMISEFVRNRAKWGKSKGVLGGIGANFRRLVPLFMVS